MLPLNPIKIETSIAENGEKFTTLFFGPPFEGPITYSADDLFRSSVECPAMLTIPAVWLFLKPWLKNTSEEFEAFWGKFATQEAERERVIATGGKKADTWKEERVVIQMVQAARRLSMDSDEVIASSDRLSFENFLLCKLGKWVMDTVEKNQEAARRLYDLLKDPSAADDQTNRDLVPRNVFESFAKLAANNQCLPTKKQVREAAFASERESRRAFTQLGLGGLPQEGGHSFVQKPAR